MTPHRLALGLVLFASRQLHVHGNDGIRRKVFHHEAPISPVATAAIAMSAIALVIGIIECGVFIYRARARRRRSAAPQTVLYASGPDGAPPHQQFPPPQQLPPQHPQWPPGAQVPHSESRIPAQAPLVPKAVTTWHTGIKSSLQSRLPTFFSGQSRRSSGLTVNGDGDVNSCSSSPLFVCEREVVSIRFPRDHCEVASGGLRRVEA